MNKGFALKISTLNSLVFLINVCCVTYLDERMTTHVGYGAVTHPHGYVVGVIGGLTIFFGTYLALSQDSSWKRQTWSPSVIVLFVTAASLPFFLPELPHGGILVWSLLIAITSFLTCFIRCLPIEAGDRKTSEWLVDIAIPEAARIERVKQFATLWHTVAISSAAGLLALVVPWSQLVWEFPKHIVTEPKEAFLLGQYGGLCVAVFSVYALLGVIAEAFIKAKTAANLLLQIKGSPQ